MAGAVRAEKDRETMNVGREGRRGRSPKEAPGPRSKEDRVEISPQKSQQLPAHTVLCG